MLKDIFENDKRGLFNLPYFIKQITDSYAVINYCGQGGSHLGLFKYQDENGWSFQKYLEFDLQDLDKENVMEWIKNYCL